MKKTTLLFLPLLIIGLIGAYSAFPFQGPEYLLNKGDELFNKGDFEGSAEYYEQGLYLISTEDPDNHIVLALINLQIGRCYFLTSNYNSSLINLHQALEEGKKAIPTDRDDAANAVMLSYALILDIYERTELREPLLEITDEFIAFLNQYLKDPVPDGALPEAEINNFLAYCYAQKGENLDEALTLIDDALEEYPESHAMIDTRAWVLYKMGRLEEAEKLLKEALTLCEKDGEDCIIIEKHLLEVSK